MSAPIPSSRVIPSERPDFGRESRDPYSADAAAPKGRSHWLLEPLATQIPPLRVGLFDECNLFPAPPVLYLLLAANCRCRFAIRFVIQQTIAACPTHSRFSNVGRHESMEGGLAETGRYDNPFPLIPTSGISGARIIKGCPFRSRLWLLCEAVNQT